MTPPTASPVSHLPLFKDLGKLVRPEVFSFTKPGSLRAEVSGPRSDPSDPLVVSTGQRNSLREHLRRCSPVERLARPRVQSPRDRVEVRLR